VSNRNLCETLAPRRYSIYLSFEKSPLSRLPALLRF